MNILLTGATGYIGRRLLDKLLTDNSIHPRLFIRNARKVQADLEDRVELFEGNTLEKGSILKGLEGIKVPGKESSKRHGKPRLIEPIGKD